MAWGRSRASAVGGLEQRVLVTPRAASSDSQPPGPETVGDLPPGLTTGDPFRDSDYCRPMAAQVPAQPMVMRSLNRTPVAAMTA